MGENREIKPQAIIEILDSGPLKITGNFHVKDFKRDQEISPDEVLICRCGKSTTMPYCDESHKK